MGDTMSKKNKQQVLKNNGSEESTEYRNLIIIIVIIVAVFLIFYLATVLFTKKDDSDNIFKQNLDASEIQYNEIIIGEMFNQGSDYYVLLEEENDQYESLFESYITSIRSNGQKIYTVDLSSAFNKTYIGENNSYEKDDFKVSGTTLIRIKNSKITEHYEDKDEIADKLSELSKEE
jgi:hypothetical protein